MLTGGICTQSAGLQADKMSIEDWNAALLEYCSSDFFSFCLHHQGIYIINTICMRCMDSGINLTPKFSGRFFSTFILGSLWGFVSLLQRMKEEICARNEWIHGSCEP